MGWRIEDGFHRGYAVLGLKKSHCEDAEEVLENKYKGRERLGKGIWVSSVFIKFKWWFI